MSSEKPIMTTTTNDFAPSTSYFLLGLLVGGAVALLFAPHSGQKTRGKIRKAANDAAGKVTEGVAYVKTRSGELAGNAENFFDAGKQRIAQEGQRLEAAIKAGKDAYMRESPAERSGEMA